MQLDTESIHEKTQEAEKAVESGIPGIPQRLLTDRELQKLADFIMEFAQTMTGVTLYPYEHEFGWRICYSLLREDAEELTALFSRQSGKTETVAVVVCGLMVLLPVLARTLTNDERISKFKDGVWCGIYAPNYEQAGIMWARMKVRMYSKSSKSTLLDGDIDIDITNARENMVLPNGSFVDCGTASPQASIEGKTYHLILLEECLGPDSLVETPDGMFRIEEIVRNGYSGKVRAWSHEREEAVWAQVQGLLERPAAQECYRLEFDDGTVHECTGAHPWFLDGCGYISTKQLFTRSKSSYYNTSILLNSIGEAEFNGSDATRDTSWRRKFALSRQEVFEESTLRSQSFSEADRLCAGEARPASRIRCYESGCAGKSRQGFHLGESTVEMSSRVDSISRGFVCRTKESGHERLFEPVVGRGFGVVVDGRWKPASPRGFGWFGDQWIFGPRKSGHTRVSNGGVGCTRSAYRGQEKPYVLDSVSSSTVGTAVRNNSGLRFRFDELQTDRPEAVGVRHLRRELHSVSDESSQPGVFLTMQNGKEKAVRLRQIAVMKVYDLKTSENNFFASGVLSHNTQDINSAKIRASIHPMAAATAGTLVKIGTCNRQKSDFYEACRRNQRSDVKSGSARSRDRTHFQYDYTVAQRYNAKYQKYVAKEMDRLGYDSDDFRMKYRLHWLLERGMFVSPDMFDECGIKTSDQALSIKKGRGRRIKDVIFTRPPNVVTYDPTTQGIVAAIDVGRENSTVVTVGKVFWDGPVLHGEEKRFPIHIYNWLELYGDDHEAQHPQIVEFLKNYKVDQVIVDATGKGDPVYSRLASELDRYGITVTPFVFTAKSKDVGYKVFHQELTTRRYTFPAGAKASRLQKWQRFNNQMYDLEKEWRGSTMIVHKAKDVDAADDFCDSAMMLCWLVNVRGTMEVDSGANPLLGRSARWLASEMKEAGAWFKTRMDPRRNARPSRRGRWD